MTATDAAEATYIWTGGQVSVAQVPMPEAVYGPGSTRTLQVDQLSAVATDPDLR